ncbi:MAG: ATP-dependent RecD-like DNA helicase [Peptoniphilaceae bacterium]|nr:ATP-dependent RecD-like DNA helicase [Peptoniphilaceae bacterium]
MKFKGIVNSIIFRNDKNGYSVISLDTEDGKITAVGVMPFFNINDKVEIDGEIIYHKKFGEQIAINKISLSKPDDKESIVKFLSSSNIKGIGKKTAEDIYKVFKEDSIDLIFDNPKELKKVKGIGEKKLKDIVNSVSKIRDSRDTFIFLQSLDISYNLSTKIYNKYLEKTIETIKKNPYSLIDDINGIGFIMADKIAKKLKIDLNSKFRIKSALVYLLKYESEFNGNCTVPYDILLSNTKNLINVGENLIKESITECAIENKIKIVEFDNEKYVYDKNIYNAEKSIAFTISNLSNEEYPFDVNIDIENKYQILSDEQKEAVKSAFENKLLIITGGPGTGKTTIIKTICELCDEEDLTYFLAAPTGRAAKRINESTKRESFTIHRLIGKNSENSISEYNLENPLKVDYIIVDEVSMIDVHLMYSLLNAIDKNTVLILVGDSNQLPSVGPGNILEDLINSDIKKIKLNKIFRQAKKSNIIVNAHRINEGKYPFLNQEGKDFFFINANTFNFEKKVLDLVTKRLPSFYKIKPKEIQILCITKKTLAGSVNLNKLLQKNINNSKEGINNSNNFLKLKDKVMQIKNNYDLEYIDENYKISNGVYNGDMGEIEKIDKDLNSVSVKFYDGKIVKYNEENLNDLDLSYAITIHKSQGSEFDVVLIPIMDAPFMLLNRNLLYTAVTRAKKGVILVGQESVLKKMVDNNYSNKRYTNLSNWIKKFGE